MAIRFRPMTEDDYKDSGGQVLKGINRDSYAYLSDGLSSKTIFGDFSIRTETEQSCDRDNVRGYIKLVKPVINFILAGTGTNLLRKILGVSSSIAEEIINFEKVLNKKTNELVTPQSIEDVNDMLCNAEIFKKYIDEFDFSEAIKEEFINIIKKELVAKAYMDKNIGTVTKGKGTYELLGGYYFTPNELAYSATKNKRHISEITNFLHNDFLQSGDERIVYLLNITSKTRLYGMLFEYLSVLPPGMRPDIQNRHDQFTTQYANVISANDALASTSDGHYTVQEIIHRYSKLAKAVEYITYKSNPTKVNQFSAIQKMATKKGFIRDKMLGKRADYSGRSVIVVNPKLSINQCGLPMNMMPKLFRYHHAKDSKDTGLLKIIKQTDEENTKDIIKRGINERVPVSLNRAPSLHKLSWLSYYSVLSKSKAIELNPLVCSAYNADFDGDTMAAHVPLSDEAILESKNLLMSSRNIFVPASGECTLVPRMEMVYGLNTATSEKYKLGESVASFDSLEEASKAVHEHKVKVWDTVTVSGYGKIIAGRAAFMYCLPVTMHSNIVEVSKKSITNYVEGLLSHSIEDFIRGIDSMTLLGFRVAMLYAPTISILTDITDEFLQDPFQDFHKDMEELIVLHDHGLEEDSAFNMKYHQSLDEVEKKTKSKIKEGLGENNGFLKLVESGARGTVDNLLQIYAFKGRIAKSDNEAFNAIISSNFITQLSPLEHFMSAYGTRKGLIDKSRKPGDTGYLMRLMEHTCGDAVITDHDCGTSEGLAIYKADIQEFIHSEEDNNVQKMNKVKEVFADMIVGRYEAKTNKFITKQDAYRIAETQEKITIRSIITCESQFCTKCYGVDLGVQGHSYVGLPIGFIAGQSIGEPGTQLSMRTFHKGGVAGKGDVTSDFDRLQAFIHMTEIKGKFSTYDPIAWGTGEVIEKPKGRDKKIITIKGYPKSVEVDINAQVKTHVTKGEGIGIIKGDHDVKEVIEYAGIEAAQKYLLYVMYHTYLGKATINLKHFEVLVAMMTMHLVVNTNRKDLKIGQHYSTRELGKGSTKNTKYISKVVGVRQVPLKREQVLSNIMLENVSKGIARATALGNEDKLDGSLQSIMLGLKPKLGTYYPNYMNDRLREGLANFNVKN